jgi:hypothetical protein
MVVGRRAPRAVWHPLRQWLGQRLGPAGWTRG